MSIKSEVESIKKMIEFYEAEEMAIARKRYALERDLSEMAGRYTQVEEAWVPGMWECGDPVNQFGTCIYDSLEDPCGDSCVFCGDPYERK